MTSRPATDLWRPALVLFVLAIVVGAVSRPRGLETGGPVPEAGLVGFIAGALLFALVAVELVFLGLLIYAAWPNGRRRLRPTQTRMGPFQIFWTFIAFMVQATLIGLVMRGTQSGQRILEPQPLGSPPAPEAGNEALGAFAGASLSTGFIAAGIVAALLCAGWFVLARRRQLHAPVATDDDNLDPTERQTLADTRPETLETLEPRRAVVLAYAAMEQAYGEAGLPRRAFEAPEEYLARISAELPATVREGRRLTWLFEWARFSHHAVDGGMRREAIAALARIRSVLGTAD